jgi:flagellar protein FliS
MAYSNHGRYLEAEIMGADRVKLVCLLYRSAIEATCAARRHLAARKVRERSREIMHVTAILRELTRSLDPQYEISRQLRELYAYMQTRLMEANAQQTDAPLAEVEQLFSTLLDGWKSAVAVAAPPTGPSANPDEAYQPVSCTY